MAITDELRGWINDNYPAWRKLRTGVFDQLDRIDEAHEREISRAAQLLADAEKDRDFNYANWQDCKQKVLQHNITMDELSAEIERLKDKLAHHIELPKDADGEVIHVGDELYDEWHEQNQGEVEWLMLDNHGWWLMFKNNCERFYVHEFHEWRHHHAPTVEDVLHEFICDHEEGVRNEGDLIAEYAAKLRLAGSDGE